MKIRTEDYGMGKKAEINGKTYVVIPCQRIIRIHTGASSSPYFLQSMERIEDTEFYKATYISTYHDDEVTRIVEIER
jgi:hypothetical protein